jgi:hypothetical protein
VSTTRSQLYRLAATSGTSRRSCTATAGVDCRVLRVEPRREARRVIRRAGNRQINRFVRAIGLGATCR